MSPTDVEALWRHRNCSSHFSPKAVKREAEQKQRIWINSYCSRGRRWRQHACFSVWRSVLVFPNRRKNSERRNDATQLGKICHGTARKNIALWEATYKNLVLWDVRYNERGRGCRLCVYDLIMCRLWMFYVRDALGKSQILTSTK